MMTGSGEVTTRRLQRPHAEPVGWRLAFDLPPGQAVLSEGAHPVGREAGAAVPLAHPSVSRRHALLHVSATGVEVEDLGSANGTLVNGRAARRGQRVPAADGAVIEFGSVLAVLRGPRPADPIAIGSAMARVHALVDRVSAGTIPITLVGETGVGKEVLAERIHARSPRHAAPFVRINCAAVPEALLESELFGHERGAFTGAQRAKTGLFETAHRGTLLLDEIGDLPEGIQAKLLRALDRREVLRVGGLQPRPVDVRLVAATNRDLFAMQAAGRFRADLYYRICGVVVEVPPLRARVEELPELAHTFVDESARALGRSAPALSTEALAQLLRYAWPGNVRELRHVMDAAVLLAEGGVILPQHLPARLTAGPAVVPVPGLRGAVEEVERRRIVEALDEHAGNQSAAARALGIPRRTLIARIEAYGLARPRKPGRAPGSA